MALERKAVPAPVADWRDPTGGVQPNLANYRNLAIFVNLETNIVAVESNGKVIYRMLTSPGVDGETPTGYWRTDAKGVHFYNEKEHEGADYYTVIHGNYLFHTVPTGRAFGTYIVSQGDILGQDGSHGCCRLSGGRLLAVEAVPSRHARVHLRLEEGPGLAAGRASLRRQADQRGGTAGGVIAAHAVEAGRSEGRLEE